MNCIKTVRILFLSVISVVTLAVNAMERPANFDKRLTIKKFSADTTQQKGKSEKKQKVLREKQEKKKIEEETNRFFEKKGQEIVEADKFKLIEEKENRPKYLIVDDEDQNIIFESRKISHTNPIKLIVELDKAVENKDQDTIHTILRDPIFVQQIKAFRPYSGVITEDIERFNRNINHVQQWIAKREELGKQGARTKKIQNPKTNTNG